MYTYIYRKDVPQLKSLYTDIDIYYKKFIKEENNNFKTIEVLLFLLIKRHFKKLIIFR